MSSVKHRNRRPLAASLAAILGILVSLTACSNSQSDGRAEIARSLKSSQEQLSELASNATEGSAVEAGIRDGRLLLPLVVDWSASRIGNEEPPPSRAVYSLKTDNGFVIAGIFGSAHTFGKTNLFGNTEDLYSYGCVALTAEPGKSDVKADAVDCPERVSDFFSRSWHQVDVRL